MTSRLGTQGLYCSEFHGTMDELSFTDLGAKSRGVRYIHRAQMRMSTLYARRVTRIIP